jgi:hypothetical protein
MQKMHLRLFARDTHKRWLKTFRKSTDLNGSDIQNPSWLMLTILTQASANPGFGLPNSLKANIHKGCSATL